ncbi:holin [Phytomonospora sp. NPDC050363]|uniref:holin n=1 Tax=Phytomonospora sp. NPDC050363 TaxID=3155642 RepID=UPI0033C5BF11
MWTWTFWKQALERAIKTAAQVGAALLGVAGLGILDVDWKSIGSVVALAVVASLLTSIASSEIGAQNSPSAVAVGPPTPQAAPPPVAAANAAPAAAAEPVVNPVADDDGGLMPAAAPAPAPAD